MGAGEDIKDARPKPCEERMYERRGMRSCGMGDEDERKGVLIAGDEANKMRKMETEGAEKTASES